MKKVLGLIVIVATSSVSHADIICKAKEDVSNGRPAVELTIAGTEDKATVKIGDDVVETLAIDHSIWDGHSAGMMTGKGIAFIYNNWFGCIRNAELITDLRPNGAAGLIGKVDFPVCAGGSTNDNLCSGEPLDLSK